MCLVKMQQMLTMLLMKESQSPHDIQLDDLPALFEKHPNISIRAWCFVCSEF